MNKQAFIWGGLAFLTALGLPVPAFANSSWTWLTTGRPYMLLPAVIVLTLAVETGAVSLTLEKGHIKRAFSFVALGNLLSFALPYLIMFADFGTSPFPISYYFQDTPSYTVGILFLAITLLVEVPVVWMNLRQYAKKERKLLAMIICANAVTTGLTAIAERALYPGFWG